VAVHTVTSDQEAVRRRLVELADEGTPFAVRAVCEVALPDVLADGPRPAAEIAAATGTHVEPLTRVLRALCAHGLFTEPAPGHFALTPVGQLLRSDHPLSLRDAFPLLPADVIAWARFAHTVRTGKPAFPVVFGTHYYQYLAANPADGVRHDRSVRGQNRVVLRTILSAYEWGGLGGIVDVAGGDGSFLAGILRRHRHLRGLLMDQADVIRAAAEVFRLSGVADRCEVVTGDYFDRIPPGWDTYLLKTILHDCGDDAAVELLRVVRTAMRPDSRLVVLEGIVPAGNDYHVGKLLDLHSLVLVGGPDRNADELAALLARADLRVTKLVPTSTLVILEARPA
jgi:hypothetical protein